VQCGKASACSWSLPTSEGWYRRCFEIYVEVGGHSLLLDFLYLNKLVDEEDISVMSVKLSMLDKLKARVQLARRIELAQHKTKKAKHDHKWIKETAEVLGVELDSDFVK
jgi:hypothetical protein